MKTFNYTTHSKQVLGDMHTPVSIYLKVRDMYPQSALMESSDYHAGENSLSFIALCPLASIGINGGLQFHRALYEPATHPAHPRGA